MKMTANYLLAGMTLSATLAAAAGAFANPIALPSGPLFGKFTGVEQVAAGNNTMGVGSPYPATSGNTGADCTGCVQEPTAANDTEGTFGAFVVSTLQPGAVTIPNQQIAQSGFPFFVDGQNGGNQITGFFYGTTLKSFSSTGATGNGGIVDLYWWDKNNQSQAALDASNPAALRTSQTQFTGYTCANAPAGSSGCTLLVQLDLVPGAADNSGTAIDPTLTAAASGNLAGTMTGTSDFYLEVDTSVVGAWTNQLSSQFFQKNFDGLLMPDIADFESKYDFLHCTTGCAAWNGPAGSNIFGENLQDPFTADVVVPEPGSLALLGTALLGLGVGWRRRRQR
jgi:PEP-CTERM motif